MTTPITESSSVPRTVELDPLAGVIRDNLKDLRDGWFWFVLLGMVLIVLGFGVLSYTGLVWATVATTLVFGCFMVVSGIVYLLRGRAPPPPI